MIQVSQVCANGGSGEMDAKSRSSRAGKAMRVATLFTGVAASTVGITQAANAQNAAHADVNPPLKHVGHAIRPDTATGSIKVANSCATRLTVGHRDQGRMRWK